ncbi:MAG: D-alanine--D-alanine ligase [Proteobacteria bacterium]|jgi:D-alanine-D-alanine ligase|nr:D-alanine--D-alanine ligase [Candidatus Fonsibacter sp. PEL5]NKA17089.1 D-alanine--D-alanine ligase [Candidatus Fonsibacter sp. PEL55]
MKKEKVTVLMGGTSAERDVSLDSGKACAKALAEIGFDVTSLDAKDDFIEKLIKNKPDKVFNALHGRFGEDGSIQGLLEHLKIPYTHSGILSSAIAMDKLTSKRIFKDAKISSPEYQVIKSLEDFKSSKIGYPCVVKPNNEGSSVGVYVLDEPKKSDEDTIVSSLKKYNFLILEKYIPGREIQVAVMGSKALGGIEIVPARSFYDYEAKYSANAKTKHIIPIKINEADYKKILDIALQAHNILGCRGVTRSDFRYNESDKVNKIYILEVNTQPGMTSLSLVPEIANYYGISFNELVKWIINDASINR